ncbi:MAG: hypothetical protein BAJALOKI1v1_460007 [Promethearchaeota archaeon]|nr:MAG: hypothetical protein BAJALOKI1v1_460007 [Candidatus Lokiarchaeota archaeon]
MSDSNLDLDDDEKQLYLDVLRDSPFLPFSNYVSRGDIRDPIDVARPRSYIDREVFRLIRQTYRDQCSRFLPILGSAGSGKTHAYHSFKDKEEENRKKLKEMEQGEEFEASQLEPVNWSIIYVPSPPGSVRVILHVYTCIIEEIGTEMLDIVSERAVEKWGGKKGSIFQKPKIEEVIKSGLREFPGVFADCVKALVLYQLDKDKKALAERWLLGEDLEPDELDKLGINSVLEDDDICLAMIKIITQNLDRVILLYFDEIESPYRMFGEDAEKQFLEVLKRLYNEVMGLVIVIAVLKEIWPRILEIADQPLRSRMEPAQELKPFSLNDLKIFYSKMMEDFWDRNNLNPPLYPLFPLNEKILDIIYEKTGGNPRSAIKLCKRFIDKIILDEMSVEELVEEAPEIEAVAKPPETAEEKVDFSTPREKITKEIDQILAEEEYTIEVNPSSIASATLKCIMKIGEEKEKQFSTTLEYKYKIDDRGQTIAGFVETEGKKWGIEIPSIKTFDRSAGVAGYYAVKRIHDGIEGNIFDAGIVIVPEKTGGAKFSMMLKNNPDVYKIDINEDLGKELIESALNKPSEIAWKIAKTIWDDIGEYKPPQSEENIE